MRKRPSTRETKQISGSVLAAVALLSFFAFSGTGVAGSTPAPQATSEAGYRLTDLGRLRDDISWNVAYAVNNADQVVGRSGWAFLWQDGVMVNLLEGLGVAGANAYDINDAGQVVGSGQSDAWGWQIHAYLLDNRVLTDLGTLGGYLSIADALNETGQVVGVSVVPTGEWHAFLWEDGAMTDLGMGWARDINDAGSIVGYSMTPGGERHAVLWTPSVEALTQFAIDTVAGLIDGGELGAGEGGSLIAKLENALRLLTDPIERNDIAAMNEVLAFINQLQGLMAGGGISDETGQRLIKMAESIVDQILAGG